MRSPLAAGGRWGLFLFGLILAQGMSAWSGGSFAHRGRRPYLPAVGPAPLRLLPAVQVAQRPSFPPLVAEVPAPEPGPDPTVVPEGLESAPLTPPPMPPPVLVSAGGDDLSDPGAIGVFPAPGTPIGVPAPAVVTPQMLVQFFRPTGSNQLGGVWTTPLFIPPSVPSPTRSSTATYQSQ